MLDGNNGSARVYVASPEGDTGKSTIALGILHRLPRLVGEGWARQLALTGEEIDAATGLRIGLVNSLYPDGGELARAAGHVARRLAGHPRAAVRGTKDLLEHGLRAGLDSSLREGALYTAAMLPADLAERLRAAMAATGDPSGPHR